MLTLIQLIKGPHEGIQVKMSNVECWPSTLWPMLPKLVTFWPSTFWPSTFRPDMIRFCENWDLKVIVAVFRYNTQQNKQINMNITIKPKISYIKDIYIKLLIKWYSRVWSHGLYKKLEYSFNGIVVYLNFSIVYKYICKNHVVSVRTDLFIWK